MSAPRLQEYIRLIGFYHTQLDLAAQGMPADEKAALQALVTSPAWQQLEAAETIISRRGAAATSDTTPALPTANADGAVLQIAETLVNMFLSQQLRTLEVAKRDGNRAAALSLMAGGSVVLLSAAAFLTAAFMSRRLIRRLRRLEEQTLSLADDRLPAIMSRLNDGDPIDLDSEISPLRFGHDEIGHVAEAFNRAQHAAVSAAVNEARTREGAKAVFLNIAHRSQAVVHRQLEILDRAEYQMDDPAHLAILFQLDHLATRERRNAENLIILGGQEPGRRWRNPVAMAEIVRSAVGETEDYARITVSRLPDILLTGIVVADLIHLLAELLDNATSFSPPQAKVEVTGSIVGRGVAIEISDQGLGMTEDEITRANLTLCKPTDLTLTTLSSDSRLGLYVVARLASRHGITVRLAESDYGGIRAIVLVTASLIATVESTEVNEADGSPTPDRRPAVSETHRSTEDPRVDSEASATSTSSSSARPHPPSASQARDLLSAIKGATRRGRHAQTPTEAAPDGPGNQDNR